MTNIYTFTGCINRNEGIVWSREQEKRLVKDVLRVGSAKFERQPAATRAIIYNRYNLIKRKGILWEDKHGKPYAAHELSDEHLKNILIYLNTTDAVRPIEQINDLVHEYLTRKAK